MPRSKRLWSWLVSRGKVRATNGSTNKSKSLQSLKIVNLLRLTLKITRETKTVKFSKNIFQTPKIAKSMTIFITLSNLIWAEQKSG